MDADSLSRRARVAALIPPATPPMITIFTAAVAVAVAVIAHVLSLPARGRESRAIALLYRTIRHRRRAPIPRHPRQEHAHPAGVGHAGENQSGAHERREAEEPVAGGDAEDRRD